MHALQKMIIEKLHKVQHDESLNEKLVHLNSRFQSFCLKLRGPEPEWRVAGRSLLQYYQVLYPPGIVSITRDHGLWRQLQQYCHLPTTTIPLPDLVIVPLRDDRNRTILIAGKRRFGDEEFGTKALSRLRFTKNDMKRLVTVNKEHLEYIDADIKHTRDDFREMMWHNPDQELTSEYIHGRLLEDSQKRRHQIEYQFKDCINFFGVKDLWKQVKEEESKKRIKKQEAPDSCCSCQCCKHGCQSANKVT